ncbi:MAG TPA: helix-turn-helix transcriptional regulator, partial [Symbiobacteriaceae bacterium]|nr:helix-turn-helix transcriptional regulator [Symbiobacteriaceae bacterium]
APFGALAIAMAGANVVLAMCSFPAAIPPAAGLSVLAVLAAGSILFMGAGEPLPAEQTGAPAHVPVPLGALATFAVANFFVGGIWYQIVAASWSPAWAWRPLLEPLVYAAGIALLAVRLRRDPPAMLALYGLSCLGLGLLAGLSGLGGDAAMAVHRALVLVGLAAADLFYWHQLGLRGQRAMGLGLGLSVLLIGSATMTASAFPPDGGRPHPLFLLSGAALLFLMIPLVFRPQGRAPSDAAPAPLSILAAPMPENLTPAERQVYAMLLRGASDAEIAAELVVTKHTVKFHVRNVLRKLGVANRKELLSRIVAGSGHEA